MDIRKYEALLRVIDLGNMTHAAYDLDYTQSGISHMVSSIEKEYGFPLLTRGKNGVRPTQAGEHILPKMRQLLEANQALEQRISDIAGLRTGAIHIGAFQSVASCWLIDVIKVFHADYPNVSVHVVDGTSAEMERMLLNGVLDLGIFSPPQRTTLLCDHLSDDPYLAVLPASHPLAKAEQFPISELSHSNFILGSTNTTMQALRDAKVAIHSTLSTEDNWTALNMVEAGLGISLIPQLELKMHQKKDVPTLPLDRPISRTIGLMRASEEPGPAASTFYQYCLNIIPRIITTA